MAEPEVNPDDKPATDPLSERLGFDVLAYLKSGPKNELGKRADLLQRELARQSWVSQKAKDRLSPTGVPAFKPEEETILENLRDPRSRLEKGASAFARPFTQPARVKSFLKDPTGWIGEAVGRPISAVTGALQESGLVGPEALARTQKDLEGALFASPFVVKGPLTMMQRLRMLRTPAPKPIVPEVLGPQARPTTPPALPPGPQPPAMKALPPIGGTTPGAPAGPPRTFEVGPSQAYEEAKQAAIRFTAKYGPESQQLPRVASYKRPLGAEPGGGMPTAAEVGGVKPPRSGSPIITTQVKEPVEGPPQMPPGRPMPTAREVGLERGARATEQTGEIRPPAEVFRGVHPSRALDELPTAAEVSQARAVEIPESTIRPTTGGAKVTHQGPTEKLYQVLEVSTGKPLAIVDSTGNIYPAGRLSQTIPNRLGQQQSLPASSPYPQPAVSVGAGGPAAPPRSTGPLAGGGHIKFSPVTNPNVPAQQWPVLSYWQRVNAWGKQRAGLDAHQPWRDLFPADPYIAINVPESNTISAFAHHEKGLSEWLHNFLKTHQKSMYMYDEQVWMDAEYAAVGAYDKALAAGMSESQAMQIGLRHLPGEIRSYYLHRQVALQEEQWGSRFLRVQWIPETPGPFAPRLVAEAPYETMRVRGKSSMLANDMQQTIKEFEKARRWRTMREGMANGVKYKDPRQAAIIREFEGRKLVETARFVQRLEQAKRIFRSLDDAKRAAVKGNKITKVVGIPGESEWWTLTREEALFIKQNLTQHHGSSLVGLSNELFRNPNLFNPLPHASKNMLVKYILSSGDAVKVWGDVVEFATKSKPALYAEFEKVMPFSSVNATTHEMITNAITHDPVHQGLRYLGGINKLSSKAIFQYADPALRYALWKRYLKKGFSSQAAANHTWVDLIRYSTRSQAVDWWKSIPMNFFIPWRVGTITTIGKQLMSHPVRTAALLAVIDGAREIRYRRTGRWTHLPIDYIEGPVALLLENHDPTSLATFAGLTAIFGPGGGFAANQLAESLKSLKSGEYQNFLKMFWGIAQMYTGIVHWDRFKKTGDFNELLSILTTALIAEHDVYYKPKRFMGITPLGVLGKSGRSEYVKQMEDYVEAMQAQGQAHVLRQELKDPRTFLEKFVKPRPGRVELMMRGRE